MDEEAGDGEVVVAVVGKLTLMAVLVLKPSRTRKLLVFRMTRLRATVMVLPRIWVMKFVVLVLQVMLEAVLFHQQWSYLMLGVALLHWKWGHLFLETVLASQKRGGLLLAERDMVTAWCQASLS